MNEETRLTLELEQAHERLRQARETLRLARRDHTLAVAEVDLLQTRLVRVKWSNKPLLEQIPRIKSGRPKSDEERRLLKKYKRLVYLCLLTEKEDTLRPIFNNPDPENSLAFELGQQLNKSYAGIKKAFYEGRELPDGVLQL